MAKATYVLEVSWDNSGLFTGANDDVTADMFSVECRRGRDYASQLTGRATAGRLIATLDNRSGTYSSLNSASPIYGSTVPGRKVRLRTTAPVAKTLWTGYLKQISPSGTYDGFPVATLEASGSIERLNGKKVTPAAQANQTTDVIVGAILDAAGWPAERTLNTGQTTISRWFVDKVDALNAIREIEETELGFFYEAEDGKLIFEDRHFRLKGDCLISQATFSDASGATLGYRAIEQQDPLREIYNDIVATVSPYVAAGSSAVLWTLRGETPTITAGETLSWWAEYPNSEVDPDTGAYVETWDTPVGGTDVTVTGVDISSIAIAASKFANSMKISLTNNGAATATVALLQAKGTKVTKQAPVRVSDEDTTSQTAYGQRTYQLPGPWLPSTLVARDYVKYLVSRYKDPLPILVMAIQGHRSDDLMTQALSRKISDRITVVATGGKTMLGLNADFFIEAISHRISNAGFVHETTFELSSAAGDGGYFVCGTSVLGSTTKLAY